MKYLCKDCGYKFEEKERAPGKCPYCGKGRVEREKDAEELLGDLE